MLLDFGGLKCRPFVGRPWSDLLLCAKCRRDKHSATRLQMPFAPVSLLVLAAAYIVHPGNASSRRSHALRWTDLPKIVHPFQSFGNDRKSTPRQL